MLTKTVNEPEITKEEFEMIRDFIHEKSGIFFTENKMYLVKNRLLKRMEDLSIKTFRDYFYHIKYDTSMREFQQLMNLITTNETSFFRNEPQLLSFAEEVLPLIIEEKQKSGVPKKIKIWSAGCSTGEEPYTLAMIILDKFATMSGWQAEIIANDISEEVLQKARRGEYSGITLRNIDNRVLNKYFKKNGDTYQVKPEVKSLVKFSLINLSDQRMMSMYKNFDVIFCRNVMIYFSDEVKRQIVRSFYNALEPGGYFYIGHSESLHGISKAFKLVYFKNALVYHKEKLGAASSATARPGTSATASRPTAVRQTRLTTTSAAASARNAAEGARRALDLLNKIKPVTTRK